MKYLHYLFCLSFLFSCDIIDKNSKKPNFLIGNWIQVNRMDSLVTYETWRKDFSGTGLTLNKNDTTFFEKMNIVEKNDTLFLKVTGVNETPTFFKFTNQTDSSFVAENPKNEFPTKIKYYYEYNYLKADVSNDSFSMFFVFERVK